MRWILNNMQLVIVLVLMAFSIGSVVIGKLREQAELKRLRDEARRRRQEELRTGRGLATEQARAEAPARPDQATEAASLRDLAARRQAQLREMRSRQQQTPTKPDHSRSTPIVVRTTPTPTTPSGTTGRPGIPTTPVGLGRPPRPAKPGRPRSTPAPKPTRPRPARPTPPAPIQAPQSERTLGVLEKSKRARELASAQPRAGSPLTLTGLNLVGADTDVRPSRPTPGIRSMLFDESGRPLGRQALRRAIALTEILGPPVSLRDQQT